MKPKKPNLHVVAAAGSNDEERHERDAITSEVSYAKRLVGLAEDALRHDSENANDVADLIQNTIWPLLDEVEETLRARKAVGDEA